MKNKILVVDDAELNRELLQDILQDVYEVVMSEDGEQAIEKLNTMNEDTAALLLDLQMPKMDGFAVMEEMKKQGWMNKIPVLVISGQWRLRTAVLKSACPILSINRLSLRWLRTA